MQANSKPETASGNSAVREQRHSRPWGRGWRWRKSCCFLRLRAVTCVFADQDSAGETGRNLMIRKGGGISLRSHLRRRSQAQRTGFGKSPSESQEEGDLCR